MNISPDQLNLLLLGVIPPFVFAAIIYFLVAPKRAAEPDPAMDKLPGAPLPWLLPLLLLAIFLALQPRIAGKFVLYPQSASEWPLLTAIIATVLAIVAIFLPRPGAWRLLARFGLMVTLGGFIAQRLLGRWGPGEIALWLGGLGVLSTIAWFSLSQVVTLNKGVSGPGVLAIFTMAAAVVCEPGFSSLPSAQFIGIIAWALAGVAVAALFRSNLRLAENATHVPVLLASTITFAAMLGAGEEPARLKILFGVMLALVPTLPFLVDAIWRPASPTRARTTLRLSLALVPLLVIAGIGGWRAAHAMNTGEY